MTYVLLFILFSPVKWVMKFVHGRTGKNLVIQTAKIGDYINITPLLSHLGKSDALLSYSVAPLAERDATLEHIWYIEDHRSGLMKKIKLVWQLLNRYDNIYLLHPTNLNLFIAACCNASNKQFLSSYRRKGYQGLFYLTASGVVYHEKNTLTLENYLKLADRSFTKESYPKHATLPLWQPETLPAEITQAPGIRIGISVTAGNQAKTIPPIIWCRLFDHLSDLPCTFFAFGAPNEQSRVQELFKVAGQRNNLVSLVGKIPLEALPAAINEMDFYIASDSGNVYIADAQQVPVILIYGPCCVEEQRPLGDVLLIGPNHIAPSSFVFAAQYKFAHPVEQLFELDERKLNDIHDFIRTRQQQRLARRNNEEHDSAAR
ncbi:glycosyltransferase family 9 protein [Pantoea dispersa]|uniref:glycosyltransferase family 9 protein n=1 Tax=Pantoea dispersa TaxID=59814 RepID=UPI0021B0370C|nr:glycosyltransferase family 9 protein [Pantoea dispersa]MCT6591449.1 glycosyltransferase family 9 protein [Pantoea dispersa]